LNVIGLDNPATATLAPAGSPLYKTKYNNFEPRFGVAYQIRQAPDRETVLRGGFGLFSDLGSETVALGFTGPAFGNSSGVRTGFFFPVAANTLPVPPVPAPLNPPYNRPLQSVDPNLELPYTLQWNVSLEQALGKYQSFTASYVGAAGHRLLLTDELYAFNPQFNSQVYVVRNAASSSYQSLQLQLNRRLSQGLQALISYTYSHSIDNASFAETNGTIPSTGAAFINPNIDRGNSDFDLRHAFRTALIYNIPTWNANSASRAILGRWSVGAIALAQTGLPLDLIGGQYFPASTSGSGFLQLRPNVAPSIPLYLYGAQCAVQNGLALGAPGPIGCPGGRAFNFTPGAVAGGCPDGSVSVGPFCPVPADVNGNPTQLQGTLGRNVLRDFGAWQIDFSLHRQFNLGEHANLQFRAECFNVFNHPNFSFIDNNINDGPGVFGLSQATLSASLGGLNQLYQIGGPRSIQLVLKFAF